ncbi:oocyte zinc finger protein XlCOF8.4-like [Dendropsophus ebraccatus]|uniref:oocyte zinc finger protein XlCOF8.4-like n=1 Tax=Dendropsophus ebraccatus TaxID=150705 RepID=UPI003831CB33
MAEILRLTLEILQLLTGEEYYIIKKPAGKPTTNYSLLIPLIHKPLNKQKILDHTEKMMELLTGEVPIRCQDVAVYFSMEEWEYVEGHKDLYRDAMLEDQPPLTASGLPECRPDDPPPVQEQYGGNLTISSICTSTENIQQNPSVVKEEAVSCDGGLLTDPSTCTPTNISTWPHPFTSFKEEQSPKDQRRPPLVPTQYLLGELILQDGETFTTPNLYATRDHGQQHSPPVKEPVLCGRGNLICNAQPYLKEATQPPETHSRANDIISVQFSCSECKKCFLSMAELVTHQGVHIAEKLLESRPHVFTTAVVHTTQVAPIKHKLLTCSTCGRTFYTKSSLVGHKKTHWGKVRETFRCDQCGKSFPTKSLLNLHSRLHFGDRPYACRTCGERYMRTSDLSRHQKKHQ